MPGEHRIEISNKLKSDKYQHFLTDITHYQPTVTAFEVGAQTGYISKQNKLSLSHRYYSGDMTSPFPDLKLFLSQPNSTST